jgi:hypothetical protein
MFNQKKVMKRWFFSVLVFVPIMVVASFLISNLALEWPCNYYADVKYADYLSCLKPFAYPINILIILLTLVIFWHLPDFFFQHEFIEKPIMQTLYSYSFFMFLMLIMTSSSIYDNFINETQYLNILRLCQDPRVNCEIQDMGPRVYGRYTLYVLSRVTACAIGIIIVCKYFIVVSASLNKKNHSK